MATAKPKELNFDKDVANFREDVNPRQVRALEFLDSGIKFLLYGGALGGGKSYFLRWFCVRFLINVFAKYGLRNVPVMLACEDYPALKDRQLQKIGKEFPSWLGRRHADHKDYGNCFILEPEYGSGVICFRNLDDASKYQSAEFALIAVDELTKNGFDTFNDLRMRNRWPGLPDFECKFIAGTNPGSIGHAWVKQFWIDKRFPPEWTKPTDYSKLFAYIPSLADDNPFLDPAYWQMLETLPINLRKAFRYGDWNIFAGQVFSELMDSVHGYDNEGVPFPKDAFKLMTFDWGFGKPFSIGWWFTDADGRLFRHREWYGWNGTADHGIRLEDSKVADGIIEREKQWGIWGQPVARRAGPDCFNKKPNYKGGGQGPSTAEIFKLKGIHLTPGDPSRDLKIRQFRERIKIPEEGMPMMMIGRGCEHFWRTVSSLVVDDNNIEDVDTNGEDHVYDEACHAAMARPLGSKPVVKVVRRPPRDGSEVAQLERELIMEEIRNPDKFLEW